MTTTTETPVVNRETLTPPARTKRPPRNGLTHVQHLREFTMPDGRRLLIDRRSVSFVVEAKPEEFGGKAATIIAFRTPARPCPVITPYEDVANWWKVNTSAEDAS